MMPLLNGLPLFLLLISSTLSYHDFSTHTPYEYSRGDITEVSWNKKLVPTRMYLLARHGSRHLGDHVSGMIKFADKIVQVQEAVKRNSWLQGWKRPEYLQDAHLVPQGMLEHYNLARRYKRRFPALFPTYYPTRYHVRTTHILRTSQSSASFLFGLFENTGPLEQGSTRTNLSTDGFQPVGVEMESADEDSLLRFMDNCPAYSNSPITLQSKSEVTKLQKSQHFEKLVLDPISEKVGFSLTVDDVEGLYDLCTFEHVSPTESNNSSFCDLIPRSGFALLDYERDLSRYYQSSYPNKLGYELSCVLLQDLLKQFDSEKHNTALRFAHSETLVPLITLLGINKDTDTQYTWDRELFWNRTTKMSQIDPFATNLGFVLFKNTSSDEELVKVFLNEREVRVPVCVSEEGCTRSEILNIVLSTEGRCNREVMCSSTSDVTDDVTPTSNVTSLLSSDGISQEFVDAAIAARLESENKVLVSYELFILETVLSGLCIVLIGFIAMNCKKIISDNDTRSGYQKMPFLDS